ncbi:MAG: hypothetical protein WCA46_26745 [Actinocatenispora sp.]
MDTAEGTVLPLRPLTVGELLDASIALLRRCGWPLLLLGLGLATAQQLLMIPFVADRGQILPFDYWFLASWWLGGESVAIAVLAGPATAQAVTLLLGGTALRGPVLLAAPGRRWLGTLAAAAVLGVLATVGVWLCVVPWILVYALTGLVVPVLIADGARPAAVLTRPVRLVFQGDLRPAGVRLLAYLGWLAIRVAVVLAGRILVQRLGTGLDPVVLTVVAALPWIIVDTVAYPALACLDACLHLENRMRTEGLDLALGRRPPGAQPGHGAMGAV